MVNIKLARKITNAWLSVSETVVFSIQTFMWMMHWNIVNASGQRRVNLVAIASLISSHTMQRCSRWMSSLIYVSFSFESILLNESNLNKLAKLSIFSSYNLIINMSNLHSENSTRNEISIYSNT